MKDRIMQVKKEINNKKYWGVILLHGFSFKSLGGFLTMIILFDWLYFIFHGESEARLQVQRELSAQKQKSVYLPKGSTTAKQIFIGSNLWTEAIQIHAVNVRICSWTNTLGTSALLKHSVQERND